MNIKQSTPFDMVIKYGSFKIIIFSIGSIVVLTFVFLVYGHVFSAGTTHADGSAIAIVAKNLAYGEGYATSIPFDGPPGMRYFDPGISTGPTLVIPAAILIRFFGNRPWVPGFTTATISILLLLAAFFAIKKKFDSSKSALYISILVIFLYNLSAGHLFSQWFSLMGEIPAALLCFLGAIVLARSTKSRASTVMVCFLYGLAVITKMLSLLGIVPILAFLVVKIFTRDAKGNRRNYLLNFLFGLLALIAPTIIFEAWKFSVIGFDNYLINIRELKDFFFNASGAPRNSNVIDIVDNSIKQWQLNAVSLSKSYGFSTTMVIVSAVISGCFVYRFSKEKFTRHLFLFLMSGAMTHLVWWAFISHGKPRYAFIGLILYFSAIACILLTRTYMVTACIMSLGFFIIFFCGTVKFNQPIAFVAEYKYTYTPRIKNLLTIVEVLKKLRRNRPFAGTGWPGVGDLEYAMPTIGNFVEMNQIPLDDFDKEWILVRNGQGVKNIPLMELSNFQNPANFAKWVRRCDEVLLNAPPYLVARCPKGE